MTELTDNQKKVVDAINNGHSTIDAIVENSGLSKSQVTGTITSLTKKDLIQKNEDNQYISNNSIKSEGANKTNSVTEEESGVRKIAVLIPYLKSEADGDELKFALRSLEQNLKENFSVVIIGDREDWFSPEIVHIPHQPHLIKEECDCPIPSMVRNPQADVTHKIFTAIASGEIDGDFILTNDDIFLLGPTHLSDIAVLKAFGLLDKGGKEGGIYNQNIKRTAKALEGNNLPLHRYGAHIPVLLNAESIIDVIEKYNATERGFLLTSLYFNERHPEARPIQVTGTVNDSILASAYRADIPKDVLEDVFRTRKFINCNSKGWSAIKPFLEKAFPNPSSYEL
ncbi:hypothetical protein [Sphingobacterium mizutaii]|uniref:hypothetical protein n=1 Tax=Sphingobacterium mizutaii TaxID=1010 RepID=UPI003D99BF61